MAFSSTRTAVWLPLRTGFCIGISIDGRADRGDCLEVLTLHHWSAWGEGSGATEENSANTP
jgi:hypothetical protein